MMDEADELLKAKADAWDEGADAAYYNADNWDGWRYTKPERKNPYRKASE